MVGTRIDAVRKDRGLSIRALATKAQISTSALHRIVHNQQEPKASQLARLAEALSVTVGDLYVEAA